MGVGEVVFDALRNGFAMPVPDIDFAIFLATDFGLDVGLCDSVLGNLGRLVEPLKSSSPPDLVVGDYTPLLKNGDPNRIKSGIEGHVRHLVEHLFPAEWDKLKAVQRPCSDYVISNHWVTTNPGLKATELANRLSGLAEIETRSLESVQRWIEEAAQ